MYIIVSDLSNYIKNIYKLDHISNYYSNNIKKY